MDNGQPTVDELLVRRIVALQFPQWADLPVRALEPNGWDNRTFRLGEQMTVRLPSAPEYADQVDKEHHWLPRLAPLLPLQIPQPLAVGRPALGYPWKWSVHRWIEGTPASTERIADQRDFASELARFLVALQRIDSAGGPPPGRHNFHRGGLLEIYDSETRSAIDSLADRIDSGAATEVWEAALASRWEKPSVWIHGDVSRGNLLVQDGRLSAVIDFGQLGVGDPACDLAIAWTLFESESRDVFREALSLDADTWARGRGWILWKALVTAAGLAQANASEAARPGQIIEEVILDHRRRP